MWLVADTPTAAGTKAGWEAVFVSNERARLVPLSSCRARRRPQASPTEIHDAPTPIKDQNPISLSRVKGRRRGRQRPGGACLSAPLVSLPSSCRRRCRRRTSLTVFVASQGARASLGPHVDVRASKSERIISFRRRRSETTRRPRAARFFTVSWRGR